MQGILKFKLPEEATQHLNAVKGQDYAMACFEIDQKLRGWSKHGHEFKNAYEVIDEVRTLLKETLDEYGISWEQWNNG